jgi:hypothetical protein
LNASGKLLDVQFLTWQASKLWVIRRTIGVVMVREEGALKR